MSKENEKSKKSHTLDGLSNEHLEELLSSHKLEYKQTKTDKSIILFKTIIVMLGMIFTLIGIWAESWDILRWLATGIFLLVWSSGIKTD